MEEEVERYLSKKLANDITVVWRKHLDEHCRETDKGIDFSMVTMAFLSSLTFFLVISTKDKEGLIAVAEELSGSFLTIIKNHNFEEKHKCEH